MDNSDSHVRLSFGRILNVFSMAAFPKDIVVY